MISLTQQWVFARVRLTLRNPRALVFTFAFPLILIVLFSALNGNAEVDAYGEKIRFAQFYTPAIAMFSLVTACYTSLILGIATARDQGLLKRVRATPLPMGIYLGSWVTGAMLTGIGAVVSSDGLLNNSMVELWMAVRGLSEVRNTQTTGNSAKNVAPSSSACRPTRRAGGALAARLRRCVGDARGASGRGGHQNTSPWLRSTRR